MTAPSVAVLIAAKRIIALNEEGFRSDVYDDATGERIECKGQPTNGYGCRCRGWSKSFAAQVMELQLTEFETPLLNESWYVACDDPRRSALLEIAFNQGDEGLEEGYPDLIAAVRAKNWPECQAQCTVKDPRLKARYALLGKILLTGVSP